MNEPANDGTSRACTGPAVTPARKRSAERTRTALMSAAAFRFGRYGYDGTSVRDIAGDVGVDAALVYRYFGSKEALFETVSSNSKVFEPLLDVPLDCVADWFSALISGEPKDADFPHPVLTVLRSSSRDEAVGRLRGELTSLFTKRFAARLDGPHAEVRAELLVAWVLGTSLMRGTIQTPALASAENQEVFEQFLRAGIDVLISPEAASISRETADRDSPGREDTGREDLSREDVAREDLSREADRGGSAETA
ncbi:TetR/AcrR family transcriptional regulator [Streptomyces sp. NBRC 110028]|uniref:TetR/AcrR family transcriptional regulator n=1 Tax=Streptomyces sp. NBRC 110028 TaxID=1621260 RepID=UPI0007C81EDD|nr:TetR family transcriptional regulator [Streptomyces sp. NBRC 110028]